MTKAEELFHKIGTELPDVTEGKMFGKMCIKASNGKAAVIFFQDCMVFKLTPEEQEKALQLDDAKVFEPSAGRKMNGWIQLSEMHAKKWKGFAKKSVTFAESLTK